MCIRDRRMHLPIGSASGSGPRWPQDVRHIADHKVLDDGRCDLELELLWKSRTRRAVGLANIPIIVWLLLGNHKLD
eukprot:13245349-Alexandrium_andersonii.AAC.1